MPSFSVDWGREGILDLRTMLTDGGRGKGRQGGTGGNGVLCLGRGGKIGHAVVCLLVDWLDISDDKVGKKGKKKKKKKKKK